MSTAGTPKTSAEPPGGAKARADLRRVPVELGARAYDIVIGPGLLAEAGQRVGAIFGARRAFVVSDETVAGHYAGPLENSLRGAGLEPHLITVPAGEASKDFAHLEAVVSEMLARRIERREPVIALGGGVVGDLAGFAAAVVLRGVDFVQIPTSLLAQVDSSVGGKTGVNTAHGKNLVGAFHQPRLVLADSDVLASLPRREMLAGYAEVVKYGLINRPAFFAWLESDGAAVVAGEAEALAEAVEVSCRAKADVVARDEREAGQRALLNLGHTFGHALEAECGYGDTLLHGEAVAIGMAMAFDFSARLGLAPEDDALRVRRHLESVGLPTSPNQIAGASFDPERLLAHMRGDKKVRDGRLTFILARGIGQAFVTSEIPPESVAEFLREVLAA